MNQAIDEQTYLRLRSWLASRLEYGGMRNPLSCKYLPNEPRVFSSQRWTILQPVWLLTTSQFRLWKHLAIYPLQSHISPMRGSMSGEIQRFFCRHNRPRWPPSFKTEGGWEVCALAAPHHQAPGSMLHPRQRGTGSEVPVIWGLLIGFSLKVVHFWLSSLLNRPSRAIRIFQTKQDWHYASILGLNVCIVVRIISTKNRSRKARHDLPHPACMFVCDTSG